MFKHVITLVAGTASAQIIILITTPLLARLYSPSDFGLLAVILAAAGILVPFSTLRYETAILIKDDDNPPGSLLTLGLIILCIFVLFLLLIRNLANPLLQDIDFGVLERNRLWIFITLYVFILGLNSLFSSWHIRFQRYRIISTGRILQASSTVFIQIYLSTTQGALGLVYGQLSGLILFAGFMAIFIFILDRKYICDLRSIKNIKHVAIKHKNFPLYSTWSALLNGTTNNLPSILFAKLFTPAIAGYYSMAIRLIRNPLVIIGQSVYQVTAQHAGENYNNQSELVRVTENVLHRMAHLVIIPFLILGLSLLPIVDFVLGGQWHESGIYARILLPWLFLIYITWPLTALYNSLGYQKALLIFNMIFLAGIMFPFSTIYIGLNIISVLLLCSLIGSIGRIFYMYWVVSKLNIAVARRLFRLLAFYAIAIAIVSYVGAEIGW